MSVTPGSPPAVAVPSPPDPAGPAGPAHPPIAGPAFEQARALFTQGLAAYEAGRFEDAEQRLQQSLVLLPGRPSTLANLGATRLRLGKPQQALDALDAALAAAPDDVDAWCHHATACSQLDREAEALRSYVRALALRPQHGSARQCMALTLNRLGRHADALAALDTLLADEPQRAPAWLLHGQTLRSLGRHRDALASYRRAVQAAPRFGDAWSALGQLLMEGDHDKAAAIAAFDNALRHGADAPTQRYFLAALHGRGAPPAAPQGYVQALFDGYADDFDRHLLDVLQYRAHDLVVQAAAAALAGDGPVSALDLGCGSGLCGPLLRAWARPRVAPLTGIDLSATMLALADASGTYDTLLQGELVQHLQTTPLRHGLVVATDVFIYIGDLAPVFAGVRRVLAPGGVFAFSVERGDACENTTAAAAAAPKLQRSLRYAHSEAYLRALAAAHGLAVAHVHAAVLREEQCLPISGLVVCLRNRA